MAQFCAIIRPILLVVCLVPFTSVRQAGVALAPAFPLLPPAPLSQAPIPVSEEDERETANGKERLSSPHAHRRPPIREQIGILPASHSVHLSHVQVSPPTPVDPFRNGLGSPYRC